MSVEAALARVFVSYSRKNSEAAHALVDQLKQEGFDAYLDAHDIAPGEPWKERLGALITASEKVVFMISKHSVASDICRWEVDEAERQAKGILPVVVADTAMEDIPGRLTRLNFIFMRSEEERNENLASLVSALSTDLKWEREKTEINKQAEGWKAANKSDRFLRFAESKISSWERWRDSHPPTATAPTELQLEFISSSRRVATRRQRLVMILSVAAAIIGFVLTVVAWTQRERADANAKRAETERDGALTSQSRFLADQATQKLANGQATLAMLTAQEGLPDAASGTKRPLVREADLALTQAMAKTRLTAVYPGEGSVSPTWGSAVVEMGTGGDAWLINPGTQVRIVNLGPTNEALYSPDGKRLLTWHTGADDQDGQRQTIYLRDGRSGEVLLELDYNRGEYTGFSKNGKYILNGTKVFNAGMAEQLYERQLSGFASFSAEDLIITETGRKDGQAWFELRRAADYELILKGRGSFRFDDDRLRMVLQTGDLTAKVIETTTGKTLATLDGTNPDTGITGLNLMVFPGVEPVVRISHMGTRPVLWHYEENRFEPGPMDQSFGCAPSVPLTPDSNDNNCLAAISHDREFRVDLDSGGIVNVVRVETGEVEELIGHLAAVHRVVFSPDNRHLLTLTQAETHIPFDEHARLWDYRSGKLVAMLDHSGQEFDGGMSPDGRRVYTGGRGAVHFWNVLEDAARSELRTESPDDRLATDDAGKFAARIGSDGTVDIANLSEGSVQRCGKKADGPAKAVAFTPDGKHLAVLTNSGALFVWAVDCTVAGFTKSLGSGPRALALSGNGGRVVADFDDVVVVFEMPALTPVATIAKNEAKSKLDYADDDVWVQINFEGDRLTVPVRTASPDIGPDELRLRVYDVVAQTQVGPAHNAAAGVFSTDGKLILLIGEDSGIVDAVSGMMRTPLSHALERFDRAEFDPTGQYIVALSEDTKSVQVYDVETGQQIVSAEEPVFYPFGMGPVDFMADGSKFLVLSSGQGTFQNRFDLYETATGRRLHEQIIGDGNDIPDSAVFGKGDETIIATISGEVITYDAKSFEIESRVRASDTGSVHARSSADGNRIIVVTTSYNSEEQKIGVLLNQGTTEERIAAAKRMAAKCLDPEQRRTIFVDEVPPRWCITGAGREAQTDPENWQPLYPYQGDEWRDWLKARDAGEVLPLPR